ncbi:MAG: cytochrome d ubiquinol oxidase subunit II, partial [Solirubrobacterales bacterium]|nr:cytochrome d ubiquinol oxidase subunit II [Solirubrobacterales bacterium]
GPVWNGNEVWLIASGGILFLAFPAAYAAAFSGLYFGLIIVLWLLVGRGLALELRHQIDHPMWHSACDTVFALSSAALALVFGVALGNVVRGVPLNARGYFSLPLFHILNWYALLIGVFGVIVLCAHGANFLAWRTTGDLRARAALLARRLWPVTLLGPLVLAWPTYHERHQMLTTFGDHPWRLIFPLLGIAALAAQFVYQRRDQWLHAFLASGLFIVGLLTTMAAGLYPYILPARQGQPYGLTVHNAASGHRALVTAIVWWPLGIALAAAYFVFAYRLFFRGQHGPNLGNL